MTEEKYPERMVTGNEYLIYSDTQFIAKQINHHFDVDKKQSIIEANEFLSWKKNIFCKITCKECGYVSEILKCTTHVLKCTNPDINCVNRQRYPNTIYTFLKYKGYELRSINQEKRLMDKLK